MKTARVELSLAREGHHVFLNGVTPAELLLLIAEHHANAGGKPVVNLTVDTEDVVETGEDGITTVIQVPVEIERSPIQEVNRLRGKYAGNKVTYLFPGASPTLPTTFEEVQQTGPTIKLPSAKLTEVKLI